MGEVGPSLPLPASDFGTEFGRAPAWALARHVKKHTPTLFCLECDSEQAQSQSQSQHQKHDNNYSHNDNRCRNRIRICIRHHVLTPIPAVICTVRPDVPGSCPRRHATNSVVSSSSHHHATRAADTRGRRGREIQREPQPLPDGHAPAVAKCRVPSPLTDPWATNIVRECIATTCAACRQATWHLLCM